MPPSETSLPSGRLLEEVEKLGEGTAQELPQNVESRAFDPPGQVTASPAPLGPTQSHVASCLKPCTDAFSILVAWAGAQ